MKPSPTLRHPVNPLRATALVKAPEPASSVRTRSGIPEGERGTGAGGQATPSLTRAAEAMPVVFIPQIGTDDPLAAYWLRQVTVRLRREISWLWHERSGSAGQPGADFPHRHPHEGRGLVEGLPPFSDGAQESLDLTRFYEEKLRFFQTDLTAHYLSAQLEAPPPQVKDPPQGSFSWVVNELSLDPLSAFLLALGTQAALDHAMGSVVAVCLNYPGKVYPTLALAQKLWDEPEALLQAADPSHQLYRYGLLHNAASTHSEATGSGTEPIDWDTPLVVPPLAARQLLYPDDNLPPALEAIESLPEWEFRQDETARLVATRMQLPADRLRIVPVSGRKGSARREVVASISAASNRPVVEFTGGFHLLGDRRYLDAIAVLCWLRGVDLFIDEDLLAALSADWEGSRGGTLSRYPLRALPGLSIPLVLYLGVSDRNQLPRLPAPHWLPLVEVPEFSYAGRLACWQQALGSRAEQLDGEIAEVARRFRFGKETLQGILAGLQASPGPLTGADLLAACRAELDLDIGELAQKVSPRFQDEELILPPQYDQQFREVAQAMQALTEVHYGWGTARVWNEGGITALFAGPPGTGKTMAAEILALELDLPMYRIDLSQVVNKYIGETEKNLKRLFDAADDADVILFFDEADALFGKRSEVKDAHDRYANLEISYLLERMERFKGMAILATNRKKDLDEAFLRRLRYIVDFPLPEEEQRRRIWLQVTPPSADASEIDFDFLASQFRLSGGNIRSIMFNACLQSAEPGAPPPRRGSGGSRRLKMEAVLVAVKREYDKLNRPVSLETFGPYAGLIRQLDNEEQEP